MTACRRAGRWPLALQLLSELRDAGVAPTVYTASNGIAACEQGGRWELALQLLGELQSATPRVEPNVVVYNAALAALAKGAQSERALALLDEMKAAALRLEAQRAHVQRGDHGVQPRRRLGGGAGLWRELEGAGVRPDAVAYGAAIAACERGRRWRRRWNSSVRCERA